VPGFASAPGRLRRRSDPAAFLRSVLTITVLSGALTCWARCARRSFLWAALGGCLTGFVVSCVASLVDVATSQGGGIYNAKLGHLTIVSSVVRTNVATLGADLYNLAQAKISMDSTVGVIGP
jgi:hypothetical protein